MDDIVSSPPSPKNLKRPAEPDEESPDKKPLNLKGNQFMMPTPPDTDQSSNVSPGGSNQNGDDDRAVSPAPSSSALSSIVQVTPDDPHQSSGTSAAVSTTPSTSGGPPAKKRKLTPAEQLEKKQAKEVKEREKAEKAVQKAEEKARKDEEKARKDEEKARKDEEKREKAEEREAKKREKEMKEEQKAQEKLKKERSQMRLGAFFQKPAASANEETLIRARRRSLSLERYDDVAERIQRTASPVKGTPAKATPPPPSAKKPIAISDYHKAFLPFELQSNCTMVPATHPPSEEEQNAFEREIKELQDRCDTGLTSTDQERVKVTHYFVHEAGIQRGIVDPDIRHLVDTIQGTLQESIDLTQSSSEDAMSCLRHVPIKHLHFREDVRPDYYGSYTKIQSPQLVRKVTRNPFMRARPDTDYDYDSEAEWEEPEEGDEEVLSEDEDEADSQADANEIDDFLDDEHDEKGKRKLITQELVPQSTGLCWMDTAGRISVVDSIEKDEQPNVMQDMRMGVLLPSFSGNTIDPFSTVYWESESSSTSVLVASDKPSTAKSPMAPPRPPLQPRLNTNGTVDKSHDLVGAAAGQKGPITTMAAAQAPAKRGPKPAPKALSKEDLDEFKEAVVGSPLGKLDLQKGLKSRFPKLTNEAIKDTLSSQFAQIGKGKADKHWVFVGAT